MRSWFSCLLLYSLVNFLFVFIVGMVVVNLVVVMVMAIFFWWKFSSFSSHYLSSFYSSPYSSFSCSSTCSIFASPKTRVFLFLFKRSIFWSSCELTRPETRLEENPSFGLAKMDFFVFSEGVHFLVLEKRFFNFQKNKNYYHGFQGVHFLVLQVGKTKKWTFFFCMLL